MIELKRSSFWNIVLCIIAVAATTVLSAGTIISVTGPNAGGVGLFSTQVPGSSWTQTGGYTNVTISAVLNGATTDTVTAYLTTQIGPGTTAANEIAHATISLPGVSFSTLTLLSIPSLGPGTYYLTLFDPAPGTSFDSWADTASPTVFTGAGVTRNSDYFTSTPAGYAPASTFSNQPGIPDQLFQVTGTATPEPRTTGLALVALAVIFWKAHGRRALVAGH